MTTTLRTLLIAASLAATLAVPAHAGINVPRSIAVAAVSVPDAPAVQRAPARSGRLWERLSAIAALMGELQRFAYTNAGGASGPELSGAAGEDADVISL
jgi:hypothetical protein